jgi:2-methylisocitrate lyase-like PEP mutase family enzyme
MRRRLATASKGRQLKEFMESPEILIIPGVYDGYSARLVENAGFKVATASGAGISESHLGWADMGIMSYRDNLEACRNLASFSNLLLIADADTGYGNAVTVHFVVRAFEDSGVAGIMIEDQVWPKRCGHLAGKEVIAAEEMVAKIRSAADARRDPDFCIRARTDAAGPLGVDAAIERLQMYTEAGADLLFADALVSEEDIYRVAQSVTRPLTVNMGLGIRSRATTPLIHPKRLEEMGVAAVSYPRLLSTAAVRGMQNAMTAFQTMLSGRQTVDLPDLQVGFEELNALLGFDFITELDMCYGAVANGMSGG